MKSNNELKELDVQNRKCYCSDYIIKFEDFDPDDLRNYFFVYKISCKTLTCRLGLIKYMELLEFMLELDI